MTWTIEQVGQQDGRTAIITGANIGLGLNTALQLAAKGCTVVLACRNLDTPDRRSSNNFRRPGWSAGNLT